MSRFSLDYETRSPVDLAKAGAYRYSEDADILLVAVAKDDGPVLLWDRFASDNKNAPALALLKEISQEPDCTIHVFNVGFEAAVTAYQWEKTFGFPPPALTQWRCTQALCRMAAMPGSLASAAEFLKLDFQKDKIGSALIQKFCVAPWVEPNDPKPMTVGGTKMSAAGAWTLFRNYAIKDVETEREMGKRLTPLELKGWVLEGFQLDLRMNARGVPINLEAVAHAQKIVDEYSNTVGEGFTRITGLQPGQQAKVLAWMKERGYPADNLQVGTVEEVLDAPEGMTEEAVEALRLRSMVGYAALKKLPTMARASCSDGRVRGMFKWFGARTGRHSSGLVQLHNLKRATTLSEQCYRMIRQGGLDAQDVDLLFGSPLEVISTAIRHFIDPGEGKKLIGVDYAQIEARVLPWLAGDFETIEKFRAGADAYQIAASGALGIPVKEINKSQRQLGKVIVLACIAEGELVMTDQGLLPIEKVLTCHRVWDGVEWVHHEGVIYKGVKDVVTYHGLTATEDHQVFVGDEETLSFGTAIRTMRDLVHSFPEGAQIRQVDPLVPDQSTARREEPFGGQMPMWNGGLYRRTEFDLGEDTGMQCVCDGRLEERAKMAYETPSSSQGPLRESVGPSVSPLRRSRDNISLEHGGGCGKVGDGQHGIRQVQTTGPYRQQSGVSTGQHPVGYVFAEQPEQREHQNAIRFCVSQRRLAVCEDQSPPVHWEKHDAERDFGSGKTCSSGEAQRVEADRRVVQPPSKYQAGSQHSGDHGQIPPSHLALQRDYDESDVLVGDGQERDHGSCAGDNTKPERPPQTNPSVVRRARTYDIVNAGPRHRFTVSGVLVHNCGYGGGLNAMTMACKTYGLEMTDKKKMQTVKDWRKANKLIVSLWRDMQTAMVEAILTPGTWVQVNDKCRYGVTGALGYRELVLELPSKRRLRYPYPEAKQVYKVRRPKKRGAEDPPPLEDEDPEMEWVDIPRHQALDGSGAPYDGVWVTHEVSYYGQFKGSVQWGRVRTHGGVGAENLTQATAGDFLTLGAVEAEKRGYNQLLTVHDELVTECLPGNTVEGLIEALCILPPWAEGFPLNAAGEEIDFYTKS